MRGLLIVLLFALPVQAQTSSGGESTPESEAAAAPPQEKPAEQGKTSRESRSRLSDQPIPLQIDTVPGRAFSLEAGDGFLENAEISKGFELPTGAVWNPRLQIYGTARTAVQTYNDGHRTFTDWANRLDLFTNLQLTGTERILFGIRPLDEDGRPFSGYLLTPDEDEGWQNGFDTRVETLFFEGDIGELFPKLDEDDSGWTDFGFAVGRQQVVLQEGLLIDDTIDGIGLIRNTLKPSGTSNLRITGMWGWNDVNRGNGFRDKEADLIGLFTEADLPFSTMALDLIYVDSLERRGDSFHAALSAVQRIGELNTSFRLLQSVAFDHDNEFAGTGTLLFSEISVTPHGTDDVVYANLFWAVDEYTSASRAPDAGGPLGRVGILFAAVGLGRYDAALDNRATDVVGAAVGWQQLFDEGRKQLILEVAGRVSTDRDDTSGVAVGARWQQAFGQHVILRSDVHLSYRESRGPGFGARVEFLVKF